MMTDGKKFGPGRNETLAQVAARIDRQALLHALVEAIAPFHGKVGKYKDPRDWAAQIVTQLDADFVITGRKS